MYSTFPFERPTGRLAIPRGPRRRRHLQRQTMTPRVMGPYWRPPRLPRVEQKGALFTLTDDNCKAIKSRDPSRPQQSVFDHCGVLLFDYIKLGCESKALFSLGRDRWKSGFRKYTICYVWQITFPRAKLWGSEIGKQKVREINLFNALEWKKNKWVISSVHISKNKMVLKKIILLKDREPI